MLLSAPISAAITSGAGTGACPYKDYGNMTFDPLLHHRQSIRLKGYDYHHPGAYFITLCTQDHLHLFGHVEEWEVHLNAAGKMVHEAWLEVPEFYPSCGLDEFVVMPNHFHGVIWLAPEALGMSTGDHHSMPESLGMKITKLSGLSLPEFVQRFKSLTTTRYGHGVALSRRKHLGGRHRGLPLQILPGVGRPASCCPADAGLSS